MTGARSAGAWTHEPLLRRHGISPAIAMRHTLVWASRRRRIEALITAAPVTRTLVRRFVAGETVDDAVRAARELSQLGLTSSLDHLGEDTRDADMARSAVGACLTLVARLGAEGLADRAEVSVKLSAVGQALDHEMALDNARAICTAACAAGTAVTIDMEDHTTTDSTLRIVEALRVDFPDTGAVMQASLRRTPDDCARLAAPGSRVRLCKGAYQAPAAVAWLERDEVRSAYLRCLSILLSGGAYPMVATHDPKLIDATDRIIAAVAPHAAHEHQMLYGIRPDEQLHLARAGKRVRVYVPFGDQWYAYLMRRMAERPANLALVLRAAVSRG